MANLIVPYIATKEKVIEHLQVFCITQGIELIPYEMAEQASDYLLIIEPVEIASKMFAISAVWKPWLMENKPETRLVFAGFAEGRHANYLNLLDLPADLRGWLENVQPVAAFRIQYAGVEERNGRKYDIFTDPWCRYLPLTGWDMKKQMEKFTEGHDRERSFFQQISRLRKILVDIRFLMKAEIPDDQKTTVKANLAGLRKDAAKEWDYLKGRWKFYEPLFQKMPFENTTAGINKKMQELGRVVDKVKSPKNIPDISAIEGLRDKVRYELKPYVQVEEHY